MLYILYRATETWSWFHELCRRTILALELPLIQGILGAFGARRIIARHSLHSPGSFNVFVSDIDLTVSAEESRFPEIFVAAKTLKKLLPNLGEIELLTPEEWAEQSELLKSPHAAFWEKLYLIRKLSWQSRALRQARSRYEFAKHERGLRQTKRRLRLSPGDGGTLDGIFPELRNRTAQGKAPASSEFLEHSLAFQDPGTAMYFWCLLPDSPQHPQGEWERDLKSYIIRREILLTMTSRRTENFQGKFDNLKTKDEWISLLRNRDQDLRKIEVDSPSR